MIKVYLIPQLKLNLLSCSGLDDYSMRITFEKEKRILFDRKSGTGAFGTPRKRDSDGLFTAKTNSMENSCKVNFRGNAVPDEKVGLQDNDSADVLWHKRRSHTNYSEIKEMVKSSKYGMNIDDRLYRK